MSEKFSRFDWAEIHRRLDRDMARLGTSIATDEARAEHLLRTRARELASVSAKGGDRAERIRAIVLLVGSERYAFPLHGAHEVTKLPRLAIVPGAGEAALGIINWHGELVMAFDLARLLGVETESEAAARKVVVMRGEEPKLALVVDGVDHVTEVDTAALQQVDPALCRQADVFRGMTPDALVLIDESGLTTRLREELIAA